jgi:hypothetical protein
MTDLIRDIDDAMLAARRSRDLPSREQIPTRARDVLAHQVAVDAFAELNGWRATKSTCYNLGLLGRSMSSSSLWDTSDFPLLAHSVWLLLNGRYVAAIGQPYLSAVDVSEARAALTARDIILHVPPDPLASFHDPGWTLFLVFTKPSVRVRFLPEQDGRLKGLWRDWLENRSDNRAAAMDALLAGGACT